MKDFFCCLGFFCGIFLLDACVSPQSKETAQETRSETAKNPKDNDFSDLDEEWQGQEDSAQATASKVKAKPEVPEDFTTLPMPEAYSSYGLEKFLLKYQEVFRVYEPLYEEWSSLRDSYLAARGFEDKNVEAIRERVNESPERAHWTFCFGVYDVLNELNAAQRQQVLFKQEKLLLSRIKVLLFFAKELDKTFSAKAYTNYVKKFYIDVNKRLFGQEVRPRAEP